MSLNSNTYTILFAALFTGTFGILLAVLSTALNPLQERNRELEKKSDIMASVGYVGADADDIEATFQEQITQKVVNQHGEVIGGDEAFDIEIRDEIRKHRNNPDYEMNLPLFLYTNPDTEEDFVILPLSGNGLWGPLWGYVALESDYNTIYGANFDHASETPGLGAEIRTTEFQERFTGKKIYGDDNELVSVRVLQGTGNPTDEHTVDGLSGSTVTTTGVTKMLERSFKHYESYFMKQLEEKGKMSWVPQQQKLRY